ncbi:MAG: SGNH/GDSL hydrolase family protein [Melioribacteraceae bacterium]|nr:SGNH/GDSL hydrolase family protein [Melioribacteraceae bacterium]
MDRKTLHIIGDSISIEYGPFLKKFIEKYFTYSRKEGRVGDFDLPEGANAGDSSMVLEYLKKCKTEKVHWDIVLINCGLHDIKIYKDFNQISIRRYERNLEEIFKLTKLLSDQTIWLNITPVIDDLHNSFKKEFKRYNSDVIKYNEIGKRLAQSNCAFFIDLYEFCKALGGQEIYRDHVHFIDTVQKLQAAFIAGHLKTLL